MRTPPPTVSGMKTCSAVREMTSSVAPRPFDGRRDVQEHELVGSVGVVARGEFHRVAGVAQVLEPDALHHAAGVDVEARDDALGQHRYPRITCDSFSVFS